MKTIDTALDILEYIVNNDAQEVTPSMISDKLSVNISSAVRILKTLTARGYLSQDGNRAGYCQGPILAALGSIQSRYKDLINAAAGPMKELSRAANGGMINLSILNGNNRIILYHTGNSDRIFIDAFYIKKWYFWDNATEQLLLASLDTAKRKKIIDNNGLPQRFSSFNELSDYLDKILANKKVIFQGEINNNKWILGGLVIVEDYPPASIGFAVKTEKEAQALLPKVGICVKDIEKNLTPEQFFY